MAHRPFNQTPDEFFPASVRFLPVPNMNDFNSRHLVPGTRAGSHSVLSTPVSPPNCPACQCAVSKEDRPLFQNLVCDHLWHHECLNKNLRFALKHRSNWPAKCCRMNQIHVKGIEKHLDKEVVDLLHARLEEYTTLNPTYCYRCSTFVSQKTVSTAKALLTTTRCERCDIQVCVQCGGEETSHTTRGICPDPLSAEDRTLANENGWRHCPSCKALIERIDGCKQMTCSQCLTGFCYECGKMKDFMNDCRCPAFPYQRRERAQQNANQPQAQADQQDEDDFPEMLRAEQGFLDMEASIQEMLLLEQERWERRRAARNPSPPPRRQPRRGTADTGERRALRADAIEFRPSPLHLEFDFLQQRQEMMHLAQTPPQTAATPTTMFHQAAMRQPHNNEALEAERREQRVEQRQARNQAHAQRQQQAMQERRSRRHPDQRPVHSRRGGGR